MDPRQATTKEQTTLCSRLLPEFEYDGSLRDIYVLDTNIDHWTRLLRFLSVYYNNIKVSPPFEDANPIPVSDVLDHTQTKGPVLMQVSIDKGVTANCHFFCETNIEFDLDPRQVNSISNVGSVLEFMGTIGTILGKDVLLAEENSQDCRLALYKSVTGEFLIQ